ncbi:MAG: aspartate aminotransferase family protein [Bacillota bacterium]|nr:aspartate aminotransferase family protein [Bacillota bacterium]
METSKLLTLDEALQLGRKEVKERYKTYVNPSLANMLALLDFDKQYVQAEGCYVWDSEGNKYLDFLGGYGALNLGHNHPKVIEAITKVQALPNLLQASMGTLTAALASNLAAITPGDLRQSFFCNSGAEAVEGALKLARAATNKKKIIYCAHSFHGKTFGALSVTGRSKYQVAFMPLVPECEVIAFGDAQALEQELQKGDVAAFILEPIQGEGGIIVPPLGYLSEVRRLCSQYKALMIADEIQTGFGRTGYMFACDEEGVVPDIMCLAKALGGGIMPIGAYITTADIWEKAYSGMDKCTLHTSTFGGNAWACAAGISTIGVLLEENLPAKAKGAGEYLLSGLRRLQEKYPLIADVRGKGLLVGVEFTKPEGGLLNKLTGGMMSKLSEEYLGALVAGELQNKHGIITAYTLNNPNVIRLEPPLTVTEAEIDQVLEALDDIFQTKQSFLGMAVSSGRSAIGSTLGSIFKK